MLQSDCGPNQPLPGAPLHAQGRPHFYHQHQHPHHDASGRRAIKVCMRSEGGVDTLNAWGSDAEAMLAPYAPRPRRTSHRSHTPVPRPRPPRRSSSSTPRLPSAPPRCLLRHPCARSDEPSRGPMSAFHPPRPPPRHSCRPPRPCLPMPSGRVNRCMATRHSTPATWRTRRR